jgi:hypothetical protein
MKAWKKGVNVVGLIINGQQPRLDARTQKLILCLSLIIVKIYK